MLTCCLDSEMPITVHQKVFYLSREENVNRKKYLSQIWEFWGILTTKWGFVQISLFFSSINMNFLWQLFPTFGFSSNICDLPSNHLDSLWVVFPQFGFPANMSDQFSTTKWDFLCKSFLNLGQFDLFVMFSTVNRSFCYLTPAAEQKHN